MRTTVRLYRIAILFALLSLAAFAQSGGELRFCIHADPKTFNPLLVGDDPSETVRYLTAGVLLRMNRVTQQIEPELAKSWKVSPDGRTITFKLRGGIYFSDGTPFSANDVAYTMQQLMDPSLHSPTGDEFRSSTGKVETTVLAPDRVAITFHAPIAGLDRLFDQVGIMSASSPKKEMAVLGPFYMADHKPGVYVLLKRNPNYWKHDASGKQLPYLDSVRLYIQQNHDVETMRFVRGEIDLINTLDAEYFEKLASQSSGAHDAGVGFDTEQIWFNQAPSAPIPAYKKAWFTSTNFRRGVSQAVNREDLARVVFRGHAHPAVGPISPANTFWFNSKLKVQAYDPQGALKSLAQDGFHLDNSGVLRDRAGNAVEFSVITNSGNKYRQAMATMMQQDLSKIGIRLNVVTLDFPALIERISRTFNYESCLLGLVNDDLDPNAQMNVWLSSSSDHQWNPEQKSPATAWEAELDTLMREQASTTNAKRRKQYVDRVQEIVYEQNPFIYLVNKDGLSAISRTVQNASVSVLRPQTYWNIDEMWLQNSAQMAKGRE